MKEGFIVLILIKTAPVQYSTPASGRSVNWETGKQTQTRLASLQERKKGKQMRSAGYTLIANVRRLKQKRVSAGTGAQVSPGTPHAPASLSVSVSDPSSIAIGEREVG